MIIAEVTYRISNPLGGFNHSEEIGVKIVHDVNDPATGDDMMRTAKELVLAHVTKVSTPVVRKQSDPITPGRKSVTPNRTRKEPPPEQIFALPYAIRIQNLDWKDRETLDVIQKVAGYKYVKKELGGSGLWYGSTYPTAIEEAGIRFSLEKAPDEHASETEDDIPF